MRETIGGTWILQLVVGFILLFVAFLVLTLNYSKSFKVKNEVIAISERNEGITDNSINTINNYLKYNNYNTKGKCNDGWYGVADLESDNIEVANPSEKYFYCINEVAKNDGYAYEFVLFFRFNLPIIGDITTYKVKGTTINLKNISSIGDEY